MARDIIHETVCKALIKDQWKITHDPYRIKYGVANFEADLGAEKRFAAERDTEKIVVEIKSFLNRSNAYDLHVAVGQYRVYNFYLQIVEPERRLYLAVDHRIFAAYLSEPEISAMLAHDGINLIVVNLNDEEIIQWIDHNTQP